MELNKVELPGERFHDNGYRIHAATAFRAADGQMIVEYPYRWWAYSPDGVSFRELSTVSRQRSRAKGLDRADGPGKGTTGFTGLHHPTGRDRRLRGRGHRLRDGGHPPGAFYDFEIVRHPTPNPSLVNTLEPH